MSRINTTFEEVAKSFTNSAMIEVTIHNEKLCSIIGIETSVSQRLYLGLPYNIAISKDIPVLELLLRTLTEVAERNNTGNYKIDIHSFQIINQN